MTDKEKDVPQAQQASQAQPEAKGTAPKETVEQSEDRVLDGLLGIKAKAEAAPEKKAAPEPKADAKGDADAEEDEQAKVVEDDAEASGGDEGDDDKESADDIEKAITSLRRAKIPQTVLKKMSNREILALSKDMAQRQAEIDNTYRELGEFKKKVKDIENRRESSVPAEPAEQPQGDDLDVKALIDIGFDENSTKVLRSFADRVATARTKQLQNEVASMASLVERMLEKEIRNDLRVRYSEVDKADKWERIKEKAGTLAKTGDYAGSEDPMRLVFEDAARLVLGEAKTTDSVKPETNRAKANGQPTPKSKQVPPRSMTPEEREDAALMVLINGGSREDAKKVYG